MNYPHCDSKNTYCRPNTTDLGYQEYRCQHCSCQFNERTGTVFNYLEYPTDVVILAVRYYYEFKTSFDDVVKLMAMRGFELCHQTVWNWTQTVGVELALQFRARRVGQAGKKWHADPTYIKVEGRWCYLYRCIDKEGNLVDVYLSNTRDDEAANAFFQQCFDTTCVLPDQITVDKERALANGINHTFHGAVDIRDNKFMNNRLEQDHRGIKDWYRNMRGFKRIFSALVLCTVFEEFRQHFRMKGKTRAQRRTLLASKFYEFNQVVQLIT
jgi:putative transposase